MDAFCGHVTYMVVGLKYIQDRVFARKGGLEKYLDIHFLLIGLILKRGLT